jgi:SLOG in TRPM, prokaryote
MPTAGGSPRVKRMAHPDADIRARAYGLPRARPVLAVFGSADALDTDLAAAVLPVLRALLAAAVRHDAAVVTAGADTGVTHLVGLAAESLDGRWPRLIGVAPSGRVAAEEAEPAEGEVRLNANHDTAVLVPGSQWGEEVPALFRAVDAIAGAKRPALALLVGGGDVARRALVDHLGRDRPLLVLAGTGALADEVAGGRLGEDDDLAVLVRSGQVAVVHLDEGPERVVAVLHRVLGARAGAKLHAVVEPPAVWPRLRPKAVEPHPVIDPGYVLDYPLLADAIHEANQVVAPVLHDLEAAAARERERARLLVVLAIAAGFAATSFGALQAWLRDVPWPGVLLAVAGAVAAVLAVVSRGGENPDARVRAEQLRSLYFDHLAAPPPVDDAEREERSRELATAVARHRHEPVRQP